MAPRIDTVLLGMEIATQRHPIATFDLRFVDQETAELRIRCHLCDATQFRFVPLKPPWTEAGRILQTHLDEVTCDERKIKRLQAKSQNVAQTTPSQQPQTRKNGGDATQRPRW